MINTTNHQNQIILARRERVEGQKGEPALACSNAASFCLDFSQPKAGPTLADFFLIKQKGKVETTKYNFGYKSMFNI
ncbi:hypothetical protein ABWH96_07440 [Marivirga tractuosa]|uniref:hypothetical protein n=1 Tax=Marivirga tractuosa TaxID=1006 RepID=UPI0035CF4EA4